MGAAAERAQRLLNTSVASGGPALRKHTDSSLLLEIALASPTGPLARMSLTLLGWIGDWAVPGADSEGGWALCSPSLAWS